jgi:glutathione synthase/RimK-type ligase-like ATP-grasp enzyme
VQTHSSTVINRPAAGRSNLVKPFQLAALAAAGLMTPDTLVTTDPTEAHAFLNRHRRIVYKSLSGIRSVVAAIGLGDVSSERLDQLGHGPVQLQQWIGGTDVRVHVVGERWFATTIASDATDYRYASTSGRSPELTACELPEVLGQRLVAVTSAMGLLVSGVDLRRTPSGEWFCFEVNPSPGFTYYEAHTSQPIAAAIADLLTC